MLINATSSMAAIRAIQSAMHVLTALELTSYQFPPQTDVSDGATYDYIIVGAGTAGCVIANRLTEDLETNVLLIEAGGDPQIESNIPSLMLYLKESTGAWKLRTEDNDIMSSSHRTTEDELSQGKSLGGTSALSYLLYTQGNHRDYDHWAEITKDETWSWKNVLPYLKKSQALKDPLLKGTPDAEFYGKDGNIGLTIFRTKIGNDFVEAFKEMGNNYVPSLNGNISLGLSDAMFAIDNDVRQSTATSYLSKIKTRPNLHVLKNTEVTKIIFDDDKNAVGVEAFTYDNRIITINANKEVIVSAGAFNSPKLLMLSGIGPKEHLDSHNIATISDLPVGQNLQTHLVTIVVFNMTKTVTPFYKPWNPYKYPAVVLVLFASVDKSKDTPDYQAINFINTPKDLMKYCIFTYGFNDEICNNLIGTDTNSEMMFSIVNKQNFKSKGKVLLKSNDFKDPPAIYSNYYSDEQDLEDHARIIADFVKIEDSKKFKDLGAELKDPKLEGCKNMDKTSIEYWKCYVKAMFSPQHHYACTCAMGSVVDSRLRVKGVQKLRVADASVMPHPTTGGVMGPTIMIGEKVSDMIKEDDKQKRR